MKRELLIHKVTNGRVTEVKEINPLKEPYPFSLVDSTSSTNSKHADDERWERENKAWQEAESKLKIYPIVDEVENLADDWVKQYKIRNGVVADGALATGFVYGFNHSQSLTPFSAKDMVGFGKYLGSLSGFDYHKRLWTEHLEDYIASITPKIGDTILCEVDELNNSAKIIES